MVHRKLAAWASEQVIDTGFDMFDLVTTRTATSNENCRSPAQTARRRAPLLEFRLDESKNRLLLARIGYRYLPSYTGGSAEQRGVLEGTARFPLIGLFGDVLLSDRNRLDLRFIDGEFSWRYRNRLSAEREFSIGKIASTEQYRAFGNSPVTGCVLEVFSIRDDRCERDASKPAGIHLVRAQRRQRVC